MTNVLKKSNMCVVVREYQDNNGENKKVYKTIGELTTFDKDGEVFTIGEIYHMPGVRISIFEQKEKSQETRQNSYNN